MTPPAAALANGRPVASKHAARVEEDEERLDDEVPDDDDRADQEDESEDERQVERPAVSGHREHRSRGEPVQPEGGLDVDRDPDRCADLHPDHRQHTQGRAREHVPAD
jgi:hypothetical protein